MRAPSLKGAARLIAAGFFRVFDLLIPKDERIALVTRPDGDDQGASLCLELKRGSWKGRVCWLVHEDTEPFKEWSIRRGLAGIDIDFVRLYSMRGVWSYLRARYVFYTHGALFNYAPPAGKVVVNLWHGMPIKKIWRGVPGSELPKSTYLLSTSDFFSRILIQASGFGPKRILNTGLPRNDFLKDTRPRSVEMVARLRGTAERLIFFMPTYRSSARGFKTKDGIETNSILGIGDDEAEDLHAWLIKNRCKLLVKPHPMSINVGKPFPDDDHWAMIDDERLFAAGLGLYELLAQADLLVTDVSSVFVDFLVTGRPQILFFPDLDRYERTRGLLVHPLLDFAPGPLAQSFADLMKHLDSWRQGDDDWKERRQYLRDLMVPPGERSSARAVLSAVGILQADRADRHFEPVATGVSADP